MGVDDTTAREWPLLKCLEHPVAVVAAVFNVDLFWYETKVLIYRRVGVRQLVKMGGTGSTNRNVSFGLDEDEKVTVIEGVKVHVTRHCHNVQPTIAEVS